MCRHINITRVILRRLHCVKGLTTLKRFITFALAAAALTLDISPRAALLGAATVVLHFYPSLMAGRCDKYTEFVRSLKKKESLA